MVGVTIQNVSGCDLVTILDSVRSNYLEIRNQCLGTEETQALVRAIMKTRVEWVVLYNDRILDIEALESYSLQGKFRMVNCVGQTKN